MGVWQFIGTFKKRRAHAVLHELLLLAVRSSHRKVSCVAVGPLTVVAVVDAASALLHPRG
jgi:inosine-uridine nucleoside N-ribohydrolase